LRPLFGHASGIRDETEITQSFEPPPPVPPPDARPPRFVLRDVGPWLALLGILAVAGLLAWIFVLRDRNSHKPVVPAVVGLPQQQAISRLTADGYDVKAIVGPSKRPRGIVVSQAPGGGSQLPKGDSVTLHVSNGHPVHVVTTTTTQTTTTQATTTSQAATSSVPDVVGQDAASAAGQVEAAGFVAETDPVSASGAAGSVVQESPAAGTNAPAGSVVRLSVATGSGRPAQQVPNVVGQKAAAARAALLQAKLTVRTTNKKGKKQNVGVVLSESPTGSQPAYTQITIVVGS
jgi:beta-lactam-binding protein with PASTA domain